jgi:hypothetical protein
MVGKAAKPEMWLLPSSKRLAYHDHCGKSNQFHVEIDIWQSQKKPPLTLMRKSSTIASKNGSSWLSPAKKLWASQLDEGDAPDTKESF